MVNVTTSRLERKVLDLHVLGKAVLVVFFILLTGMSAHVRIYFPFSPVPFTLQTLAVLLSGIVLKEFGSISQMLYVLIGIVGVNLFAGGGGLSYILSPTFGLVSNKAMIGLKAQYKQVLSGELALPYFPICLIISPGG